MVIALLALGGCSSSPHVIIATGTTVGIKATPGDGQTQPPQLVLGYKRAETAIIPVDGTGAERATSGVVQKDAASTLASFYMKNQWTSDTQIRSFIGTGFAARSLVEKRAFQDELRPAVEEAKRPVALDPRERLRAWLASLEGDESRAQKILDVAEYPRKTDRTALESLHDYIDRAESATLARLAAAFARVP
jgi:hypothetical protein